MFVLVRAEDSAMVAKPGSRSSYTHNLKQAQVFRTREEADRDRCPGNESIVPLESLLEGLQ